MPVASELLVKIGAETSGLERGLSSADRQVSGFAKSAGALGAVGTAAFAALATGTLAVGAGATTAALDFAGFQKQMNEAFTLLPGISGQAMGAMTGQVKDFAREFGVLPEKVVPALYQAISAGVPADNVFDFLTTAQKAAAGGVTDLTTAVNGISSVMNAYGSDVLSAAQASDIMFTGVRLGKTTFAELSNSLFNVAPVAASLGVGFGDVTAALATMTAQGVPTSVATTQMRQALVELSKEGQVASDNFKHLSGVSFRDFIGAGGTVQQALQILEGGAKDAGIGINEMFGSVEAGSAALLLTGTGTAIFSKNLAEMATNAGATDKAFATMQAGVSASFDRMRAAGKVFILDVGEKLAPSFAAAADMVVAAMPKISAAVLGAIDIIQAYGPRLAAGLSAGIAAIPGIIATIQAFGAAIAATFGALGSGDFSNVFGPIITAISLAFGPETAGKVTLFVSSLVTGLNLARDAVITAKQAFSGDWISADSIATPVRLIGEAFTLLGDGVRTVQGFLAGLPTPVLAAAAGFIALGPAVAIVGAALPLLIGAFTGLGPVIGVLTSTLPLLGTVIAALGLPITLLIAAVAALGIAWATNFMGIQQAAAGPIAAIGALITGTLIPAVQQGIAFIAPLVAQLGTAFQTAFTTIAPVLQQIGAGLLAFGTSVGPIFATLGGLIVSSLGPAITALINFGSVIIPQLALAFANLMQQVGPVLLTLAALITANMTTIQTVMTAAWTIITTIISTAFTVITSLVTAFVQVLSGDFTGAWATIEAMVATVWTNIQTLVMAGVTAITALLSAFAGAIAPLLQSAWDGITSAVGSAWSAITSAVQSGVDAVTSTVGGWASSLGSTVGYVWAEIQATAMGAWEGIKATVIEAVQGIVAGMQAGWAAVTGAVQGALDAVRAIVLAVWGAIPEDIRADMELIVSTVGERFSALGSLVQAAMAEIAANVASGWATITSAVGSAMSAVGSAVEAGWSAVTTAVGSAMSAIGSAVESGWSAISSTVGSAMSALGSAVDSGWSAIQSAVSSAVSAIQSAVSSAWASVSSSTQSAWSGFASTVSSFIGQAVARVQAFGGEVASALGSIAGTAAAAAAGIGAAIISGISGALRAGAGALASIAGDVVRGALDAAKGALGIHSPSKEFAYVGEMAMQGFGDGFLFVGKVIKKSVHENMLGILSDAQAIADKIANAIAGAASIAASQITPSGAITQLPASWGGGRATGAALGDSVASGARDALQIKSPSQVFSTIGNQIVAGLVQGMDEKAQDAAKKAADVASAVAGAIQATLSALGAVAGFDAAKGPSGGQIAGVLAYTKQLVAGMAEAAGLISEDGLKATDAYAKGAASVVDTFGKAADLLAKLGAYVAPSATALYDVGKALQAAINEFGVIAETVGTEMLDLAVGFSDGAGKVAEAVGKGADGLSKLATFVQAPATALYAMGRTLRLAINDFAVLAESVTLDMTASAATFAEGAGKVADTVGKAATSLTALNDYIDPPRTAIYALGKTVMALVADFGVMAEKVGGQATKDAAAFADGAGKVVAIVGGAVDGFTKLGEYKGIANSLIAPFVETVRVLVAAIGQAAAQFTSEGLTLAGQFADAAAKGVGILSNGVDGFAKLATYKGVGDAAIGAFVATVTTLVRGIGAASTQFTADGLTLSGQFADAAAKAVGILGAGVTGFAALATFVGPTQATMDAFLGTVRYTVARFGEMATILDADGTKATSAFADAAGKALGAVGAGVTAFKDMATLVLPVPAAIDDLVNTIRYAVGQVAAAAGLFGGDTLAAATAFGTAASGVFAALKSGLDLFTALGKLDAPLTTNWLDPLVQLMGGVLARSATLVTQAQQLRSDADLFSATLGQAFAGFTNAGGGFGGGLVLGSPVPVAVPNGGGGGGGGGGGTTNIYITITGNTILSDDPATADALARLLKPRLAQVGGY